MAPCRAMIGQQVTLSGDAELPKVADAVIEACSEMHGCCCFANTAFVAGDGDNHAISLCIFVCMNFWNYRNSDG